MIKVGAICDNLALGGQEMGCIGLLRALDRSLFSAHLYSFRAGSLLPEAQALGIPIVIGAPELAVGESAFPDSADSTTSFAAPRNSMLRERFRKVDRGEKCTFLGDRLFHDFPWLIQPAGK